MSPKPAVFLDRDGTIMRDTAYVREPDDVELLPGAAGAIRRLNEAPMPVIVVTNQSGIARGLLTEQDYERVRMRLDKLLTAEGARIDASYHCPHHPDFTGPCQCRKPGVKLFRQAAAEHDLDLSRSYYVGDQRRDVEGILIQSDTLTPDAPIAPPGTNFPRRRSIEILEEDGPDREIEIVDSLAAAVDLILSRT